jgi:hypothetical protein
MRIIWDAAANVDKAIGIIRLDNLDFYLCPRMKNYGAKSGDGRV